MRTPQKATICLFVVFMLLPGLTFAAGFKLQEQSATGMGQAFAGDTAGYGDGSEVFYNPAAMSQINGTVLSGHGHLVIPSSKFTNTGSVTATGTPLTGGDGPDGGENAFIPNLYFVVPLDAIDENLTFGMAINSPFGLATDYSKDWVGRYQAVRSELTTMNFNPAVAYEVTDGFSLGVGLRAMRADAELSNAIDFGTVGVATLGLPTAASLGLLPQAADGFGVVKGGDWGAGITVGTHYDWGSGRIGVAYQGPIHFNLRGSADFTVPMAALPLTSTGAFTDTTANAHLKLPESISASVAQEVSEDVTVTFGGEWTRWSRFEELRINFDNGQPDTVVDESWNNAWRAAVGVNYQATEDLLLRAGWQFDESPVPDAEHRTPRIPGNDRNWLSLGGEYALTDEVTAVLGYTHIFVSDSKTRSVGSTGDMLVGEYDANVNLVSAALVYRPNVG